MGFARRCRRTRSKTTMSKTKANAPSTPPTMAPFALEFDELPASTITGVVIWVLEVIVEVVVSVDDEVVEVVVVTG